MTDRRKPDAHEADDPEDLLLSALYRQGADELPSPALDQAICEQARKSARRRRWFAFPKLAVAFTLVLGVGLALRVFDTAPPQMAVQDFQAPPSLSRPPESSGPPGKLEHVVEAGLEDAADVVGESALKQAAPPPVRPMATPKAAPQQNSESARSRFESKMRERAARPSTAPSEPVSEMASGAVSEGRKENGCQRDRPADEAGRMDWLRRIRGLRQAGEIERSRCLQQLYSEQFAEPDQPKR